jgi:hypothetical protein
MKILEKINIHEKIIDILVIMNHYMLQIIIQLEEIINEIVLLLVNDNQVRIINITMNDFIYLKKINLIDYLIIWMNLIEMKKYLLQI